MGPRGRSTSQRFHLEKITAALLHLIDLIRPCPGHGVPGEGHAVGGDGLHPQVFRGAWLGFGVLLLVLQDQDVVVVQLGLPPAELPGEGVAVCVAGQVIHGGGVGFAGRFADAAARVGAEPGQHAHGQAACARADLGLELIVIFKAVLLLRGSGLGHRDITALRLRHRLQGADLVEIFSAVLYVIRRRVARRAVEDVAPDGLEPFRHIGNVVVVVHRKHDRPRRHGHRHRAGLPAAFDRFALCQAKLFRSCVYFCLLLRGV